MCEKISDECTNKNVQDELDFVAGCPFTAGLIKLSVIHLMPDPSKSASRYPAFGVNKQLEAASICT